MLIKTLKAFLITILGDTERQMEAYAHTYTRVDGHTYNRTNRQTDGLTYGQTVKQLFRCCFFIIET